jgi:hypothetical protein
MAPAQSTASVRTAFVVFIAVTLAFGVASHGLSVGVSGRPIRTDPWAIILEAEHSK